MIDEALARLIREVVRAELDRVRDELRVILRDELRNVVESKRHAREILTVREAADVCALAEGTIREWIRSGRLRALKLGRSYRVKMCDLLAIGVTADLSPTSNEALDEQADRVVAAARRMKATRK